MHISCINQSWLASVDASSQQVTVEMFNGEVGMCREVEVMLEESDSELVDNDSDKFRTAV